MEGLIFILIAAIFAYVKKRMNDEPTENKAKPFLHGKEVVIVTAPEVEKELKKKQKKADLPLENERKGRLSIGQQLHVQKKAEEQLDKIPFPTSKQELIQGIIFSEILSKPKSLRK